MSGLWAGAGIWLPRKWGSGRCGGAPRIFVNASFGWDLLFRVVFAPWPWTHALVCAFCFNVVHSIVYCSLERFRNWFILLQRDMIPFALMSSILESCSAKPSYIKRFLGISAVSHDRIGWWLLFSRPTQINCSRCRHVGGSNKQNTKSLENHTRIMGETLENRRSLSGYFYGKVTERYV